MGSCGKCGTENKENVKFCKSCGTPMGSAISAPCPCISCAAPLAPGAKFCKKCGATVATTPRGALDLSPPLTIPRESASAAVDAAATNPQIIPELLAPQLSAELVTAPKLNIGADAVPPRFEDAAEAASRPALNLRTSADVPASNLAPKSSRLVISVCIALLVVIASGSGFYWWNGKKSATTEMSGSDALVKNGIVTAPLAGGASAQSSLPPNAVPAAVIPVPVMAAPIEAHPTAVISEQARATLTAPSRKDSHVSTTKPLTATNSAPVAAQNAATAMPATVPDVMARKVATLLAKADGYISSRQYDKAIATAESALELDPGSQTATAMINKAKARQIDALKSGSSLD